jgi:hypothetical protein
MGWESNDTRKEGGPKPVPPLPFLAGILVMFSCFYLQYVLKRLDPFVGSVIVYGLPVTLATVIRGREIIRSAFSHMGLALQLGIGSLGVFELLGTLCGSLILQVVSYLYPESADLLARSNPVLNVRPEFAWVMVFASVLLVGPAEQCLFTGYVFGGLLSLDRERHWVILAFLSSLSFALAHLYYATTYGIASLVVLANLIAFGMAMNFTYYFSGGNILVPALIHGFYDAGGFLSVAVSPQVGSGVRDTMALTGLIAAAVLLVQSIRRRASV